MIRDDPNKKNVLIANRVVYRDLVMFHKVSDGISMT